MFFSGFSQQVMFCDSPKSSQLAPRCGGGNAAQVVSCLFGSRYKVTAISLFADEAEKWDKAVKEAGGMTCNFQGTTKAAPWMNVGGCWRNCSRKENPWKSHKSEFFWVKLGKKDGRFHLLRWSQYRISSPKIPPLWRTAMWCSWPSRRRSMSALGWCFGFHNPETQSRNPTIIIW